MGMGCLGQGKEVSQRPSHCPPNSEAEGGEGVGDHQCLPREEGCTADGARAPPVSDGA